MSSNTIYWRPKDTTGEYWWSSDALGRIVINPVLDSDGEPYALHSPGRLITIEEMDAINNIERCTPRCWLITYTRGPMEFLGGCVVRAVTMEGALDIVKRLGFEGTPSANILNDNVIKDTLALETFYEALTIKDHLCD